MLTRSTLLGTLATCTGLMVACGGDDETSTKAPPPPPPNGNATPPPVGDGVGGVTLTEVGSFTEPVYVTQPSGEQRNLFVVDRAGQIRVIRDGKVQPRPFLELSGQISASTGAGEQGLLSMAFAPDYGTSGLFYVYYTDPGGDIRIVEYQRSADDPLRADPDSARLVIRIEHSEFENHNGGLVMFGPDGLLYTGIGDGGDAGDPYRAAQDLSALLGKILRIDPLPQGGRPYGIPKDNPFVDQSGARPEIFEYGLRNPWRFSFDPANDALLIGDVGQDEFEEVDYLPKGQQAGANLGWSAFEGDARFNQDQTAPGAVPPIYTYSRDRGCSITGGYVVRDRSLESLYGRYIYGDFCEGALHSFIPAASGAKDDTELGESVSSLSSFGVDSDGHLYATSLEGPVYRIDPG